MARRRSQFDHEEPFERPVLHFSGLIPSGMLCGINPLTSEEALGPHHQTARMPLEPKCSILRLRSGRELKADRAPGAVEVHAHCCRTLELMLLNERRVEPESLFHEGDEGIN